MTGPAGRAPVDWFVVRAVAGKDLRAMVRSKAVLYPMLLLPALLLVVLPLFIGAAAMSSQDYDVHRFIRGLPGPLSDRIFALPADQQLVTLVLTYGLAPLFLVVPLTVSAVSAADTFAGEKDRRTLESLLHLPVADRDLMLGKTIASLVPAVAVSWIGFILYAVVANSVAWPVTHRVIVPTAQWLILIFWFAPAVALFGLAIMVRVSARVGSAQEANQLGGAIVLPLIFLAVGQATGLLLVSVPIGIALGVVLWLISLLVFARGAKRFTRDRLASKL